MEVRVVRDSRVAPGGEGTVELPGEILFVVSADGITQVGAEALEDGWGWFISRGLWRYGERGGRAVGTVTYERASLPPEVAVRVRNAPGRVDCLLSPCHFTIGSVNGLQVAARASVKRGWRYYEPEVPAALRRAS